MVVKERLRERVGSWANRNLSYEGRAVFIKAVLQALPMYAMSVYLLPKTLCSELNRILNRFWWKQSLDSKGIFWTTWSDLCYAKNDRGIGLRDMQLFNIALLAKQGWRLVQDPGSLVARIFRAKYYNGKTFMTVVLGQNPSYIWKSIWSARKLIEEGICLRIGSGHGLNIWDSKWIPSAPSCGIENTIVDTRVSYISDLIDPTSHQWNVTLIESVFSNLDAERILKIPLPNSICPDVLIWNAHNTGLYTTKSGYKLLHKVTIDANQAIQRPLSDQVKFYKFL